MLDVIIKKKRDIFGKIYRVIKKQSVSKRDLIHVRLVISNLYANGVTDLDTLSTAQSNKKDNA